MKVKRFPVAVCVGVDVGEGPLVAVGVAVAGCVGVGVAVGVDVPTAVGVEVRVGVDVGAPVDVGVNVAVGIDPPPVSTISCGVFPDSRLARLMAVLLFVVTARLKTPFPVMNEVTSIVFQVLALTDPEDPSTLPTGGALL